MKKKGLKEGRVTKVGLDDIGKATTLESNKSHGEFTGYQVQQFNKLIGKDVIVAHQLLKNDIEQHEYWLVTQGLLPDGAPADLTRWMQWNTSAKQTETGAIPFHYTQLSPLKKALSPEPSPQLELSEKVKMLTLSQEYDTDIITLFHATGDFHYRSRWQEGVHSVEEVGHFLPRVGMRCRCVMEDGEVVTYASSYLYHPERIEFSETDEKKQSSTRFLLEKKGNRQTKLTLDFYIRKNLVEQLLFILLKKKKTEDTMRKSLRNLTGLVQEIQLPAQELD